jgi:hypothetical protein
MKIFMEKKYFHFNRKKRNDLLKKRERERDKNQERERERIIDK